MARALADLEERVSSPIHLIVGMLSTKDASGFLRHFQGLTELAATVEIPGHTAAYKADELAHIAYREGIAADPAESLEAAFESSRRLAQGPVRNHGHRLAPPRRAVLEAHENGFGGSC